MVEERFPSSIENVSIFRTRILQLKSYLKDYISNSNVNGKVAIVAHSALFRILTANDTYWNDLSN